MKKRSLKKGFTLIETMVAIFILVLATLGPMTIASQGLNQALFARDQVTAYYLADEAIEYIRNIRDVNIMSSQRGDWLAGLGDCISGVCRIDSLAEDLSSAIASCPSSGCPRINVDSAGEYFYNSRSGGQPSPFTRSITMTQISPEEYKVSVKMNWNTANIPKSFTITENIMNTAQI